jgi:pectin methylesterase-like acyl-CoA thioesterase
MTQDQKINHAAYRTLRETIKQTYPAGRYVAISGGQVVADGSRFDELQASLQALGKDSPQVLVVQAGVDYPETVTILA